MMRVVLLLLLLLWPTVVMAQKPCDQARGAITSGVVAPVERVAGIAGKRIYLCGYVIMRASGGPGLEFEITSGTGTNCSTGKTVMIPRMDVPIGGLVNRIPYAAGEKTAPGHSVCLQTWGTGSVTSIFYWTQF
jgi:hypothetical protein